MNCTRCRSVGCRRNYGRLRRHACFACLSHPTAGSTTRRRNAVFRYQGDWLHDFEHTLQLNYFGALWLTMGLLSKMMGRRAGQMINISSIGVHS